MIEYKPKTFISNFTVLSNYSVSRCFSAIYSDKNWVIWEMIAEDVRYMRPTYKEGEHLEMIDLDGGPFIGRGSDLFGFGIVEQIMILPRCSGDGLTSGDIRVIISCRCKNNK